MEQLQLWDGYMHSAIYREARDGQVRINGHCMCIELQTFMQKYTGLDVHAWMGLQMGIYMHIVCFVELP